jgi:hypothetical protein
MKIPRSLWNIALFAPVALSLLATPAAKTETVIGNLSQVATTFVVSKEDVTATCGSTGCHAKTSMFSPIDVTCPAPAGSGCVFHISLDVKTSISFKCGGEACEGPGPTGFYQILVDGAAPTIGPTNREGRYLFEKNVFTVSNDVGNALESRQSYPASVLSSVANSVANANHKIVVNVGCVETVESSGCETTAHWRTMTVDVFLY